jgi:alpha-tubulin suppressor-like RCC1 family protein
MATIQLQDSSLSLNQGSFILGPQIPVPQPQTYLGNLIGWGDASYGKIGNPNLGYLSLGAFESPVQVATDINTWTRLSFSTGAEHFGAVNNNGTLHMWGRNQHGQIGNGSVDNISSPIQIGTDTNWDKISTSLNKTAASKTDGTLWAWGFNYPYGELGNNEIYHKSSPVMIMSSGNIWTSVSLGYDFGLAVRIDGKLYGWGRNSYGQLGINNTVGKSSVVQIGTSTDWSKVATGSFHALGLKNDGTVWVWGKNTESQLGINQYGNRSSPVQLGSATDWVKISAGGNTSFGIRMGGNLYGWGDGSWGTISYGANHIRSQPEHIMSGQPWFEVASNGSSTAAISSGQIYTWGDNQTFGQLGQNTIYGSSSPAPIYNGDTNFVELSAGYLCYIARKS